MKIALIDSYDSFTFNIAHYLERFVEQCDVIPVDQVSINQLESYDRIVLSPGPGLPNERVELYEVIKSYYTRKPILGICLGHQAIAEFFNAQLFNMKEVHHGFARNMLLSNDELWETLPKAIKSARYHSWAVSQKNFSDDLKVIAIDAENKHIMAIKHKSYPIIGLQFHPESVLTENGLQIIENWIKY
ncbi:MAG: aminodeoxychorismate/anthranilate synthase component II [Bacteroidales bacterium]|nr:aminodeoxychorismate/anthranilate synthase component II [Bacteroidales bacterium]